MSTVCNECKVSWSWSVCEHHVCCYPVVAVLLLSTYFLNDWPAHMLNKHHVPSLDIWRPVKRPAPFVVRQVCDLVERYLLRL